jgi:DNA-binding PadR family transcriptional regulator
MFSILAVLAGGDSHGYAIMREAAIQSGGAVRVGAATLYRTIKQLLERGLIEETGDRPAPDLDDQRRRYYRLTAAGRDAVESETQRMEALVALARSRLRMAASRAAGQA